ncbi:MAG: Gfo/Idh/MocA family oxidoreductase [Rhodospirillaceae bacterium]|nr:Gfo/Idh/MocA family oxidoreductase [Rhodospirillaceae bacterium]
MASPKAISVAQIGYGYWGTNLARNAAANPQLSLDLICDVSAANRAKAAAAHPTARILADSAEVFADATIDAVIVVTPASTHAEICQRAIEAGKHVLVTKPLATSVADAAAMAALAAQHGRTLLIDHTFLYTPAVAFLKQALAQGDLGKPLYYDSVRTGLGIFKSDVNIVDDLAIHDIAILEHLFAELPATVSATAAASFSGLRESLAYITLTYRDGLVAHLAAHWLSPLKQRQVVIAGDARMLAWDDSRVGERIRIFDSGITRTESAVVPGRADVSYRNGEVTVPTLGDTEALAAEMADFVTCIRSGAVPRASGQSGVRVMRIVAAAHRSAAQGGAPAAIEG